MKRDPKFIESQLYVKDNRLYTKVKTIIEFPKWYSEKELATIEDVCDVYGIFTIIIDEQYSVSVIPTLCSTTPIMIKEIERDGVEYYQFLYGKDDCILNNTKVVKNEKLSYNFFENFYMMARIPWFIEYQDLVRIMDNTPKYAKSNIGDNLIANELVTSFITRLKENKTVFYRQSTKKDYTYVDLMNVGYSSLSSLSKLSGNYFQESLVSALVQKEKEPTKLENLVRK